MDSTLPAQAAQVIPVTGNDFFVPLSVFFSFLGSNTFKASIVKTVWFCSKQI
jgi:hypothetical protein